MSEKGFLQKFFKQVPENSRKFKNSVIQEQDGSKTMKEIYQEYLKQADIDQKEARG